MTTPQLHVLQIKRSKGVKHYCHIIHALSHLDTYEVFALDYFDSVLLNSCLPTAFIREVERVRGLKAKSLYITGCTYADVLQTKLDDYRKLHYDEKIHFFKDNSKNLNTQNKNMQNKKTILLAPSWGRESLLSKYGMEIIKPFIDSEFFLIIRPHPQSFVSESSIIASLQEETKACKNIAWDTHKDNIYALECADLMIGDFSGVMFDFVCLFEKPLLIPELHFNVVGYDLEDICDEPWINGALHRLGKVFSASDIRNIDKLAFSLLNDSKMQSQFRANIASIKDELWSHRGFGGEMSARAIFEIQKGILESRLGEKLLLHTQINELQALLGLPLNSKLDSSFESSINKNRDSNISQNAESIRDFVSSECLKLSNDCVDSMDLEDSKNSLESRYLVDLTRSKETKYSMDSKETNDSKVSPPSKQSKTPKAVSKDNK